MCRDEIIIFGGPIALALCFLGVLYVCVSINLAYKEKILELESKYNMECLK